MSNDQKHLPSPGNYEQLEGRLHRPDAKTVVVKQDFNTDGLHDYQKDTVEWVAGSPYPIEFDSIVQRNMQRIVNTLDIAFEHTLLATVGVNLEMNVGKTELPEMVITELKRNGHSMQGMHCTICSWKFGATLNIPMCDVLDITVMDESHHIKGK